MKPLISVIVPVYNLEDVVEGCINSILAQTYENLEIILVNDGSSDKSPEICDKYRARDSRIVVIHQQNGGISRARNAALDIMRGAYVAFVDGDDAIAADYIDVLYGDLTGSDADVAICSWQDVLPGDAPVPAKKSFCVRVMGRDEALRNMLYQEDFDSAMWAKLYKSTLLTNIRFPEGKIYEDLAVSYKVLFSAHRVVFRDYQGYYYTASPGGIMLSAFNGRKMDLIDAADDMLAFISGNRPELEPAAVSRVVRSNFHIYLQIPTGREYTAEKKRIEANIKKYRKQVLGDRRAKRGTKIALLTTYFGFKPIIGLRGLKVLGKK